jgi:NAD(P)-dependent dehydrogenase (short-subunit alcohol dehydrogenase family)
MPTLAGKRCLLVGGTGGLGAAAARLFLEEGAHVALAGNDADIGNAVAQQLAALGPCFFHLADVTRSDEVDRLFADAVAALGAIDVLYHLAGGSGRRHGDGALHECSDDGWQATLALNLTSVFFTNRAAVRHWLTERKPGVILNLASVLAFSPSPRHFDTFAYTAAKAAIIGMSRQAAARYAADGIRVNVLAPGLIDTPMARRAVEDPAIRDYLATKQPLRGGPGQPDDCAAAAVFLCGDAARFISGVVMPVDGGWSVS